MEAVVTVAVATLHEHAALTEALGEHLPTHVVQVQSCGQADSKVDRQTDSRTDRHEGGETDRRMDTQTDSA